MPTFSFRLSRLLAPLLVLGFATGLSAQDSRYSPHGQQILAPDCLDMRAAGGRVQRLLAE